MEVSIHLPNNYLVRVWDVALSHSYTAIEYPQNHSVSARDPRLHHPGAETDAFWMLNIPYLLSTG